MSVIRKVRTFFHNRKSLHLVDAIASGESSGSIVLQPSNYDSDPEFGLDMTMVANEGNFRGADGKLYKCIGAILCGKEISEE